MSLDLSALPQNVQDALGKAISSKAANDNALTQQSSSAIALNSAQAAKATADTNVTTAQQQLAADLKAFETAFNAWTSSGPTAVAVAPTVVTPPASGAAAS